MFYVYEYYKTDSDEVFYVGKGTRKRLYELRNRSYYFMAVYRKYDCAVRLVADNLTNAEACRLEIERIAEMQGIGQAYCNFTVGGTGFSTGDLNPSRRYPENYLGEKNGFYGKQHTEETRRKISESRKGKGGQFGEDNPMYGKGRKGSDNPMYGRTGDKHHGSKMFAIVYPDGTTDRMTSKQCEGKFGIAFTRIRQIGGVLRYKKKTGNGIYEGTTVTLEETCND